LALSVSEPVKVRCPVCKNIFVIKDVSDKKFTECDKCGNRLKVPQLGAKKRAELVQLPEYRTRSIQDTKVEAINIFNSRPLIRTIVLKDIIGSWKYLLILFIIGIIAAMALAPIASTTRSHESYLQELEQDYEDPDERARKIEAVETDYINIQFGIAMFFTVLIFIAVSQTLYGNEIRKGTIRSLALYPLDMNGLTIAKIGSITIMSGLILFFIFIIPLSPFFLTRVYPHLPLITATAYFINILVLIACAFTMHIFIYFFKNIKLSLNRLIIIFIVISTILTETVLRIIGGLYLVLSGIGGAEADEFLESWHNYFALSWLRKDINQYDRFQYGWI
jgi:ABC-type transport system involved in multi-copper enzyme maturation permease subunit/ribosomal protein S27E